VDRNLARRNLRIALISTFIVIFVFTAAFVAGFVY